MLTLQINETTFFVKEDITILEACKFVGIKIPRFCYHENLSLAGNCRMCLVRLEFEQDEKFLFFVACLTDVEEDMEIITNDAIIQKAREEILEFLLINHPLDCPICDQAGECDLQDQAKAFGNSHSKFRLNKVSVDDKNFNVFIKTIMTRCIHCTRCIRFSSELTGTDFFGTLNRGHSTEIGTYYADFFKSEISANVIDLCPVGALTSKSYAFKVRPWELKSIETIDLTDSLGSNVYANFTEGGISRIIPKYTSELNENLITDKSRYSFDSFDSSQCLDKIIAPKIHQNKSTILINALRHLNNRLMNKSCLLVVSDETNYEILNLSKTGSFFNKYLSVRSSNFNATFNQSNTFFNTHAKVKTLNETESHCLLFAVNPKTENALINARIRFLQNQDYLKCYYFGYKVDSQVIGSFLNIDVNEIFRFLEGKNKQISQILIQFSNCLVLTGSSFQERGIKDDTIKLFLKKLNPSLIYLNVQSTSNSAGCVFNFIKPITRKKLQQAEINIFVNCKESKNLKKMFFFKNTSLNLGWFNTHSLNILTETVFQIPIKNMFEEQQIFFNLEFRPQMTQKFLENKFNAQSLFVILSVIFNLPTITHKSNDFIKEYISNALKFTDFLHAEYTSLIEYNAFEILKISQYPFKCHLIDFYKTPSFCAFSTNMQLASQEYQKASHNFF